MFVRFTEVRVRYGETDQMGIAYYGAYPLYLEVGRVEAMRSIGMPYSALEAQGVMLPVRRLEIDYLKPAVYDDLIRIETAVEAPTGSRLLFSHRLFDSSGQLLAKAKVELVFVDSSSRRPIRAPEDFLSAYEAGVKSTSAN